MKVVLLSDVPNVGKTGDLVDVKEGFARNFLLSKKLAEIAGGKTAKKILSDKKSLEDKNRAEHRSAEQSIKSLDGKKITFKVKVNSQGHPYKAVASKDIAKLLNIDSKFIEPKSLKELGLFEVKIHSGKIISKITVAVTAEK